MKHKTILLILLFVGVFIAPINAGRQEITKQPICANEKDTLCEEADVGTNRYFNTSGNNNFIAINENSVFGEGNSATEYNLFKDYSSDKEMDQVADNPNKFWEGIANLGYYLFYLLGIAFGVFKLAISIINYFHAGTQNHGIMRQEEIALQYKGDIIEVAVGLVLFGAGMPIIKLLASLMGFSF